MRWMKLIPSAADEMDEEDDTEVLAEMAGSAQEPITSDDSLGVAIVAEELLSDPEPAPKTDNVHGKHEEASRD